MGGKPAFARASSVLGGGNCGNGCFFALFIVLAVGEDAKLEASYLGHQVFDALDFFDRQVPAAASLG